jgi:cadmium resistance transport/sequestration family protein
MAGHLLLALLTFIITNIDDLLILAFFFASPRYKARSIVIGQYLGIIILIVISLSGLLLKGLIPYHWIGLMGLFPIYLGIRALLDKDDDDTPQLNDAPNKGIWQIALVTIANGGDNIGVYTPLFVRTPTFYIFVYVGVFLALTGFLCYCGYYVVNHPRIGEAVTRYTRKLMPWFFIGLGLFILYDFVAPLLIQ